MKNFACWTEGRAEAVMKVEVERQQSDAVFLAVHRPVRMARRPSLDETEKAGAAKAGATATASYPEPKLLADLFATLDAGFALVAVVGERGTGKSHLIRWLDAHVPRAPGRRVIRIPKVGTNLRSILLAITDGLAGERFDAIRHRVRQAPDAIRPRLAREALLDAIAQAVGTNAHEGATLTEEQAYFAETLPLILRDLHLRQSFLRDGGIIDILVRHALGETADLEGLDDRREFTVADLPLDLDSYRQAAQAAQEAIGELRGTPEHQDGAVRWINDNLSRALAGLLVGQDGLTDLMKEVRQELYRQDPAAELVLLIEEFKRFQGIDQAMLDAILVAPQAREQLCGIRTVLASTKGYFRDVIRRYDTFGSRVDFYVDLDVAGAESEAVVEPFVAGYLNAARLPEAALDQWRAESVADGHPRPVPNACPACPYQGECHATFGASDGRGLYPFTSVALANLRARTAGGRFNPRDLIKEVLKPILLRHADDLRQGRFPPAELLESLAGQPRLPTITLRQIEQRDARHAGRRKVLLDVWSDAKTVVDVDPRIHEAFDLPPLSKLTGVRPEARMVSPVPVLPTALMPTLVTPAVAPALAPPEPPPPLPAKVQGLVDLLDTWATRSDTPLPAGSVADLRPLVYAAVIDRIDWDGELLLPRHPGPGDQRVFDQPAVNFDGQVAEQRGGPVRLVVPVEGQGRQEVALAVQGLLLRDHHGSWAFPNGADYLRAASRALDVWAAHVLRQVRQPIPADPSFDPVPAAAELLLLGQWLLGRGGGGTPADDVDALFREDSTPDLSARGPAWQRLAGTFLRHRESLVGILKARLAATKGQSAQLTMIDAAPLLEPLRQLRKVGRPTVTVPADVLRHKRFEAVAQFREDVDKLLDEAVAQERERHAGWLAKVSDALGPTADLKGVMAGLTAAIQAAQNAACAVGGSVATIDRMGTDLMRAYPAVELNRQRRRVEAVVNEADDGKRLAALSHDVSPMMSALAEFIDAATDLLTASLAAATEGAGGDGPAAGEPVDRLAEIRRHLSQMADMAEELSLRSAEPAAEVMA